MIPKARMKGKEEQEREEKNDSGKSVWGKEPPSPHLAPATRQLTSFLSISHSVPKHPLLAPMTPRCKDQAPLPTESSVLAGTSSSGKAQRPREAPDSNRQWKEKRGQPAGQESGNMSSAARESICNPAPNSDP